VAETTPGAPLARAPLGEFPTPVTLAPEAAATVGARSLAFKRDDRSARPYGGNKVRKLEVLLAEARAAGATRVLTFGAAGSNHALATAVYATRLGLQPVSVLTPQVNAAYVRKNLLAQRAVGAEIHSAPDHEAAIALGDDLVRAAAERGERTYVIPFGGTTPSSTAGVATAGLELAAQVAAGMLPEPDAVYVALGSMGTAVGVALGLAMAGLPAEVRAVRVVPAAAMPDDRLGTLVRESAAILEAAYPDTSPGLADRVRLRVVEGFLGDGYAHFSAEGMGAIALARETAGIALEGTYTGKTFAALIADGAAGELAEQDVVFWDTYNSHDTAALRDGADYRELPVELQAYFTGEVQPLDIVP